MKIIEALKRNKDLKRKIEDLKVKIRDNCAYASVNTPVYGSKEKQTAKIKDWLQSVNDTVKEILRLRIALQKTNLETQVLIEIDGDVISKSIAEWIIRRRELAVYNEICWKVLSNRGIREGFAQVSPGENTKIEVVYCYDQEERDKNVELYRSEPFAIDAALEVANAVTDLIE